MDEKYVGPVIAAVKYVFKTMLDMDLEHGNAFVKEDRKSTGDITGVMGLTGIDGNRKGAIAFASSTQGAFFMYEKLVHEECKTITREIVDGMGELTNIISGRTRYELEKEDVHLYAHVPIVFVGKNAEINFITRAPIVSIPFYFAIDSGKEQINIDFVFE